MQDSEKEKQVAENVVDTNNKASVSNAVTPSQKQNLKGPSELLKEAIDLFKTRFKNLVIVYILVGLAGLVAGLVFIAVVILLFGVSFASKNYIPAIISIIIGAIVMGAFFTWLDASIFYTISEDENLGIKASISRGFRKILPLFWVTILSTVITFGGMIFLIIPGIIFSVWFTQAGFIILSEGVGGYNALLKSKEYVKGFWWAVWGRLIFGALVLIPIFIVVGLLQQLLKNQIFITFPLNLLSQFINTTFSLIYSYVLYKNIRGIKGNFEFVPKKTSKILFYLVSLIVLVVFVLIVFAFVKSYPWGASPKSLSIPTMGPERQIISPTATPNLPQHI